MPEPLVDIEDQREGFANILRNSGIQPDEDFLLGEQPDDIQPVNTVEQGPGQKELARQRLQEIPEEDQVSAFQRLMQQGFAGGGLAAGEVADPLVGIKSADEARNRAEAIDVLKKLDVDVETGATAAQRAKFSLAITQESKDAILKKNFPDGVTMTSVGPVVGVKQEDGSIKQVLLDEEGFTLKDFADAGGPLLETAGALGGVTLALSAFPALTASAFAVPVLAVVSGLAGQFGFASWAEFSAAAESSGLGFDSEEDIKLWESIVKGRTVRASMDIVSDMLLAGGARFAKGVGQKVIAPNARVMASSPQKEVIEAAERLGVKLGPGKATGSKTLQRTEAIAEKFPGSAPVIERAVAEEKRSILRAQQKVLGTKQGSVELAENIAKGINKRIAKARAVKQAELEARDILETNQVKELEGEASERINRRFLELQRKISNRSLSLSEAGEFNRLDLVQKRTKLKVKQAGIENALKADLAKVPKDQRAFITTKPLKNIAKRLQKELPPQVKGDDTVPVGSEFIGTEATLYDVIANLPDKIDFTQARNLRNGLHDRLGNIDQFPGMDKGRVKKMAGVASKMIRSSFKDAPTPQIGRLARQSQDHWAKNILPFELGTVRKALREDVEGSFVLSGEKVLPMLLKQGNRAEATKMISVLGENSPSVRASRRSVLNDIVEQHRLSSFEGNVINAKALEKTFRKLDRDGTGQIILGDQAQEFRRLLRLAGARQGLIELPDMKNLPLDANIRDILVTSMKKEAGLKQRAKAKVIESILKKEFPDILAEDEKFVWNAMSEPLDKIKQMWKFADSQQKEQFRTRLMVNMLEGAAQDPDLLTKAISIKEARAGLGGNMLDIIGGFAFKDTAQSRKKLEFILGDRLQPMIDLAFVQAAERGARESASAVGGIAAGMTLMNIMTFQFASKEGKKLPVSKVAGAWFAAQLLEMPLTRKWLTSTKLLKDPTVTSRVFQAVLPQLLRTANETFGEKSETLKEIERFLATPNFMQGFIPK